MFLIGCTTDTNYFEFDSNGGSSEEDKILVCGIHLTALDDPVRPGYKFAGWYYDLEFTEEVDFSIVTVGAT